MAGQGSTVVKQEGGQHAHALEAVSSCQQAAYRSVPPCCPAQSNLQLSDASLRSGMAWEASASARGDSAGGNLMQPGQA